MIDKQLIETCTLSPKVHAGLRDRLLALGQHAAQPPPVAVALWETDTAQLPALLREALEQPAQSVQAPGIGRVVSVQPSWEELRAVVECDQVRFVQLDAPHSLHAGGAAEPQ